jgi:hypothetical protein
MAWAARYRIALTGRVTRVVKVECARASLMQAHCTVELCEIPIKRAKR